MHQVVVGDRVLHGLQWLHIAGSDFIIEHPRRRLQLLNENLGFSELLLDGLVRVEHLIEERSFLGC